MNTMNVKCIETTGDEFHYCTYIRSKVYDIVPLQR